MIRWSCCVILISIQNFVFRFNEMIVLCVVSLHISILGGNYLDTSFRVYSCTSKYV